MRNSYIHAIATMHLGDSIEHGHAQLERLTTRNHLQLADHPWHLCCVQIQQERQRSGAA